MAESIVSGVVVKLLDYFGKKAFEALAPYFGGKRKLKELNKTMKVIQARLLDAERRAEGDNEALIKEWLKRLKDLFYRLEDLFEEVSVADVEDEQIPAGKLTKQLLMLCSCSRPASINKQVLQEAKAVMNELKAIRLDMLSLNLRVLSIEEQRATSLIRRETHSFILEEEVIGRDDDKKVIVQILLDSENVQSSISVIPIVGIGGLGETTLAQLAYNDVDIQHYFELKAWACISGISSVEEMVRKILTTITDDDFQHFNMERLQSFLRESISDKRYLLVLDDMWDEDRERWLVLRRLLLGGKPGSKIIVTTRSGIVAENMGTVEPYELGGLAEDKSWALFESLAFKGGAEKEVNPRLTSIGKEIVKKCANVPLCIRTVAGLLYSKNTEQEWEYFRDSELTMIEENDNSIMSTLKLSYDHLPSHLKQCFAYCSLFPKDYEIDKQYLIYLWMAQGFIRPSKGNEGQEDVGHAYFMELLRRSFFQDVKRNEYDDIISFKMHSLMNDLALIVARDDCLLVEKPNQQINGSIWHLSLVVGLLNGGPAAVFSPKRVRSLLLLSDYVPDVDKICSTMIRLRALDLSNANCKSLPNSIGELNHLRYLRLSSHVESLAECITSLQSLCTLDIRRCYKLKELPEGFKRLIRLRNLHTGERLIDLPSGFGKLTSLQTLDLFIVGENNGLDALATLNNLAGELKIRYGTYRQGAVSEARAANLKGKKLVNLFLTWSSSYVENVAHPDENDDEVLKWLQPPQTVRRLKVGSWNGINFPQWGMKEFPYLVSLSIRSCHRCKRIPDLSVLPHLRFLRLWDLSSLEYVENDVDNDKSSSAAVAAYFPSLESLLLLNLPELERWSRVESLSDRLQNGDRQYLQQRLSLPVLQN